ncbi:MAG: hypothetical protein BWK78_04740 [Thiotrichaceae bacterium IS1]|nr:MAG: hypothetical protein BWK78_04740 [Thiotrichaceae bacterium IS1]
MNYGFPIVHPVNWLLPENISIVRYDTARNRPSKLRAVHFYVDDFRMNTTFHKPAKCLDYVRGFQFAVGPDFSVAIDLPHAVNVWNVFRSRWVSRFWQENNIKVVPSVTWGSFESFAYVFQSLPSASVLSVRCDVDDSSNPLFLEGYEYMCSLLKPKLVLVLGNIPVDLHSFASFSCYPLKYL